MVTKEAWEGWLLDPVTREFRLGLSAWRMGLAKQWMEGDFQSENIEVTAMANAQGVAEVKLLERILELDEVRLNGILEDE